MPRPGKKIKRQGPAIELPREQAMSLATLAIHQTEFIQNDNFDSPDVQHTIDITPVKVGGMNSLLRLGYRIHQKREMCNPADEFFVLLPVLRNQDHCMIIHFYWNQESAPSPKDSKGRFNLACGVISFHMHTQADRRSGKSCDARMSATASLIHTSNIADPELLAKLAISRNIMENDISLPRRIKIFPIAEALVAPVEVSEAHVESAASVESATLLSDEAPIPAPMQALIDVSMHEFASSSSGYVSSHSAAGSRKRKFHFESETTTDDPEATEDEDDPKATTYDPEATEDEKSLSANPHNVSKYQRKH